MGKRKSDSDGPSRPKKKVAIDAPAATAKVSSLLQAKTCPPVIAISPGIQIPANTAFQSYATRDEPKAKKGKSKKDAKQKELLLHSTSHPNLDYTAKEEVPRGSKPVVNHFVGIYDPKTGKMQVIEAKKMVVRGSVRAKQLSEAAAKELDYNQTMRERKTDLGQTFGTKKARKAINDVVLNTISFTKPGDSTPSTKIDNAAKAMLASVGEITSTMATREELQAVVDEAKPVPKANLDADEIEDVYDPKAIIGGDILNLVPIREWQEKAKHNENIQVLSRFVAARVSPIAINEDATTRLRVLRYFYFVLLFYLHTKPGKQRGTRSIPQRDKLRELLDPAPEAVIENIRRKFSDAGQMRKFHIDLLMTHCCAFACIVDNFEVDTQNLRDDLRIDQKAMNSYFHEIGSRVKPVSNKVENRTVHVARLALPLDFPKQRHLAPKRR